MGEIRTNRADRLEVWEEDALLATLDCSFAPRIGEQIVIKGTTYWVRERKFEIANVGAERDQYVRCVLRVVVAV